MKQSPPVVIARMIANAVSGVYITITNETLADIHARVTTTGGGGEDFYDLAPGASESWLRTAWQVAFVLRDDTGATETFVVKPGDTYIISQRELKARVMKE